MLAFGSRCPEELFVASPAIAAGGFSDTLRHLRKHIPAGVRLPVFHYIFSAGYWRSAYGSTRGRVHRVLVRRRFTRQ